ncbi:MAG: prepilin-type N-terminal cleavage/methylation domain-containing protein [bacterium]|nr:prepilin-type N-terminal cleavage/methylation domain-containing protein [bacterium]
MKPRGFTLIELLVIISIISLLSSIVLGSLQSARAKAENIATSELVRSYIFAIESYKAETGNYPFPGGVGEFCLGDWSDDSCGMDGSAQESIALNNILSAYFPSPTLPKLNPLSFGNFATINFEGPVYYCAGTVGVSTQCTQYWIYWIIKGNFSECHLGGYDFIDGTAYCQYSPS